jgi:hypothetical protein
MLQFDQRGLATARALELDAPQRANLRVVQPVQSSAM